MEKQIHARVIPQRIKLTEFYEYNQEISRNPSIEINSTPSGKIQVIVPYDGFEYFPREAIQDVNQQTTNELHDEANISIGHLAISNYSKTDLNDLCLQSKKYESIQILLPAHSTSFQNIEQLVTEQYFCKTDYTYQPEQPELIPVQVDLQILDDDISMSGLYSPREKGKNLDNKNTKILIDEITSQVQSGFIFGDSSMKNSLVLYFQIKLTLAQPNLKLSPKINSFSIKWPLSISKSRLELLEMDSKSTKKITYNPITQSIEWFDIQLKENKQDSYVIYFSQPMLLFINQPSILYEQECLTGKIEIELPEYLLSGLQTRFYGYDKGTLKVGILNNKVVEHKTYISTNFELILDDAFQRRMRSTSQELKFDNIFPDKECVRVITDELKTQGFLVYEYPEIQIVSSDNIEKKWLISAERSEGVDPMVLWIVVHGIQFETQRTSQIGLAIHTSKDKSGELSMYLLGQFPRKNDSLVKRMMAFHQEVRKKLEKLRRFR